MISKTLFNRFYADAKYDGTLIFYNWIREGLAPDFLVCNIGAGPATRSSKRVLKGMVAEVVGADIDPIVFDNDELDRAVLIENGKLPLDNEGFDLAFADNVLEHVDDPKGFLAEVHRILKPGGSFFFRTPNLFHYVALISATTPDWVHKKIANPSRGMGPTAHEPWPTRYRMNSRGRLRFLAKEAGFKGANFRMLECEPSYLVFNTLPFLAGVGYERLVNSSELLAGARACILGRFDK